MSKDPLEIAPMFGYRGPAEQAKPATEADIQEIARRMGARIVGQVPYVGGGALGAAHLAHIYQARMAEVRAAQSSLQALGLSQEAVNVLTELAEKASTAERSVSLMQVAGQLLEEATRRHRQAV